jgi:threonine synthase
MPPEVRKMDLRCSVCGREYPRDTYAWRCQCGGLFEVADTTAFDRGALVGTQLSLWRYRAMLPRVDDRHLVTLGEGGTPLIEARLAARSVLCKLEFLAPTGSFKDRGNTVLVSALHQMGVTEVVEDSSGNAAASLAAYCARAGIRARIFVPDHASPGKLAQIAVYGAELVKVAGPRENSTVEAQAAAARGVYYASHNSHPYFVEGAKTFAYELWEQLGGRPDNLILPLGNGSLLLGAYRGFSELKRAGVINSIPRLFAVQAAACAPVWEAYRQGKQDVIPVVAGATVAEGIRIGNPVRGRQALQAVRDTGGAVIAVSEEEIALGREALARQGLYVEPTAATCAAALSQQGTLFPARQCTVLALTGSGLKSG